MRLCLWQVCRAVDAGDELKAEHGVVNLGYTVVGALAKARQKKVQMEKGEFSFHGELVWDPVPWAGVSPPCLCMPCGR